MFHKFCGFISKRLNLIWCLALFVTFLIPGQAHADSLKNEIPAMVKALNYVRALNSHDDASIDVSVLYNPAEPNALRDAKEISVALEKQNLKAGKIKARIVPITDIESAGAADVFFITHNLDASYSKIKRVAVDQHIFTISNDTNCIKSECCILILEYKRAVQVYLNESVLSDIGFDLDATFKYLAKRV